MQIEFSPKELFVFKKIAKASNELSFPAYIIGGFVRDKLLQRNSKDADIMCIGDSIELATLSASYFNPVPEVAYFKNFGTAQIKFGDMEIEFVGARKESYAADSRKPEVVAGTLEDDLNRRDFTINTLAVNINDDSFEVIDTFNGLQHLKERIIKTPLEPDRTFSDDPLRMMRGIRFAAQLNFIIEPDTLNAITKNAERIKIVSQERITDELNKIMLSPKPSVGWYLLQRCGLLEIFFPQLLNLQGAEYIDGVGHKDNFTHTLQVLDNIALHTNDLWLRWAALLHDIGKPATKRFDAEHGWTFHGHEALGAKMVSSIFTKLKLPLNEKMRFVKKLVALHLRPISLTKENITDSAIRRLLFDAGEDIDALMMLCAADITTKNRYKAQRYLRNFEIVRTRLAEVEENDKMRNWQPPITGEVIMETFNLKPCKKVGVLKDAIREAILDGVIPNNYDEAHKYMLAKAQELNLFPAG